MQRFAQWQRHGSSSASGRQPVECALHHRRQTFLPETPRWPDRPASTGPRASDIADHATVGGMHDLGPDWPYRTSPKQMESARPARTAPPARRLKWKKAQGPASPAIRPGSSRNYGRGWKPRSTVSTTPSTCASFADTQIPDRREACDPRSGRQVEPEVLPAPARACAMLRPGRAPTPGRARHRRTAGIRQRHAKRTWQKRAAWSGRRCRVSRTPTMSISTWSAERRCRAATPIVTEARRERFMILLHDLVDRRRNG